MDAGCVRTDTLERMFWEQKIDLNDFEIIDLKENDPTFDFYRTTKLYPEWPLGKVAATGDDVSAKVVAALKELKADDKAAKTAKVIGWSDPLDYSGVDTLQQSLKVGAYAE